MYFTILCVCVCVYRVWKHINSAFNSGWIGTVFTFLYFSVCWFKWEKPVRAISFSKWGDLVLTTLYRVECWDPDLFFYMAILKMFVRNLLAELLGDNVLSRYVSSLHCQLSTDNPSSLRGCWGPALAKSSGLWPIRPRRREPSRIAS